MNSKIENIQDAFVHTLKQLYYIESKIKTGLLVPFLQSQNTKARNEIREYIEAASSKLLKLERIFNYLMCEPSVSKSQVIQQIVPNQ